MFQREVVDMCEQLYVRGKAGMVAINPQLLAGRVSLNNILMINFGWRTDALEHPFVAQWLRLSREFMYVYNHSMMSGAGSSEDQLTLLTGTARVPCLTSSITSLSFATFPALP